MVTTVTRRANGEEWTFVGPVKVNKAYLVASRLNLAIRILIEEKIVVRTY
jgi:hypothetical protein